MTKFERIIVPGSKELPDCQCGAQMRFVQSRRSDPASEIEVRVYKCSACDHELRLTVWADAAVLVGLGAAGEGL